MEVAPILIGALVVAAIWGIYLFPSLTGSRNAPISSTEEFDRWTHVVADVQRRSYAAERASTRDVIRSRRRRVMVVLAVLAIGTLALSYTTSSIGWLLIHLTIDAMIAWYIGMLMQVRQQRAVRVAQRHEVTRPHDADEPPVRIVAGQ
jgi:hypothetical protein